MPTTFAVPPSPLRTTSTTPTTTRTRRRFGATVGALALAAVMTACGSSSTETEQPAQRTVTDVHGAVRVPAEAKRVIALDSLAIDTVVSLGVHPVGAAEAGSASSLPEYLAAGLENTEVVGKIAEPDLEKIAALKPDLILSNELRHGALYEKLSQIAPTVFAASPAVDWQGSVQLYADAMGRTAEADRLLAEYRGRTAALRARGGTHTADILRVMTSTLRLHGPKSFSGSVLTDSGLRIPQRAWNSNDMAEISFEQAATVDSELVFIPNTLPKGDFGIPGPTLSQFPAARTNGVHQVDYRLWITGIGVTGARQILDDLERIVR
ncbi:iron-siderophore ABC transporter substrate-binding protein [Tsukamurella sp. 8F]|uniref:ABC transporter substrate-binding protein n=1 Tax=unclassified Tsukamurella TaxID=2633480 RepID=UPI0023B9B251|nr:MULTISPECIES: iron-siderophore ABC transporter substrate-binding protein [unclassified Tsukamurella]MDF0531032.1 iron-siderophore ABC transporter substrate-binding protein [Tsukamurella sp. 8J]MDF0585501.1 iron-siderophore ABC transporter substrate-binding protein [Tsukamurella sp. 8F]